MKHGVDTFTGIRPTNDLTIANYIGAIRPILEQEKQGGQSYVFLAEHHAATTIPPREVARNAHQLGRTLIASGIKGEIYSQREVSDLVFNTEALLRGLIPAARLVRLPTLKDIYRDSDNPLNAPLDRLLYPLTMSADIVLARPREVPTGKDQQPHLELARELIRRFNSEYQAQLPVFGSNISEPPNIMSLDGSGRKMSKSLPRGAVFIDDEIEIARRKINKAVTASEPGAQLDAAVDNLAVIAEGLTTPLDRRLVEIEAVARDIKEGAKRMRELKDCVGDIVCNFLIEFGARRTNISDHEVNQKIKGGSEKFRTIGQATLTHMQEAFWEA